MSLDIKDIKGNIIAKLTAISLYANDDCFVQLLEKPGTFVAVRGGYFERKWHVNNIICNYGLIPEILLFDLVVLC